MNYSSVLKSCSQSDSPLVFSSGSGACKIYLPQGKSSGGGRRGSVRGFSRASSVRMIRFCREIVWGRTPFFITLTFGENLPCSRAEAYRRLRLWLDRCGYRKRRAWACVWRLEYQKRGAIHFHLIFPFSSRSQFRGKLKVWCDMWGSSIVAQRAVMVRDPDLCSHYVAKYAAKIVSVPNEGAAEPGARSAPGSAVPLIVSHTSDRPTGRHWGVLNRTLFRMHEWKSFDRIPKDFPSRSYNMRRKSGCSAYYSRLGAYIFVPSIIGTGYLLQFWGLLELSQGILL